MLIISSNLIGQCVVTIQPDQLLVKSYLVTCLVTHRQFTGKRAHVEVTVATPMACTYSATVLFEANFNHGDFFYKTFYITKEPELALTFFVILVIFRDCGVNVSSNRSLPLRGALFKISLETISDSQGPNLAAATSVFPMY